MVKSDGAIQTIVLLQLTVQTVGEHIRIRLQMFEIPFCNVLNLFDREGPRRRLSQLKGLLSKVPETSQHLMARKALHQKTSSIATEQGVQDREIHLRD